MSSYLFQRGVESEHKMLEINSDNIVHIGKGFSKEV